VVSRTAGRHRVAQPGHLRRACGAAGGDAPVCALEYAALVEVDGADDARRTVASSDV
jgi:hypothetical protein